MATSFKIGDTICIPYVGSVTIISEDELRYGRHKDICCDEETNLIIYLDRYTGEYVGIFGDFDDD